MDDIKKILEAGIRAPSGDNVQPWRFLVSDDTISIFNVPEKDTSLYNFRQRASLIAHGALIENILIVSSAIGYDAKLNIFPDRKNNDHIADIVLEKSAPREEPLYRYISLRATNRKQYDGSPLTPEEKNVILSVPSGFEKGRVIFVEGSGEKSILAEAISINERLVFENEKLHSFFFRHIRWSERDAGKHKDGFPIKTLELPVPLAAAFRIFRIWPILKVLNMLGLSKMIPPQTAKIYASASAIAAIILPEDTDADFLTGGRIMQRIWLEATRMGLSIQPMTGITFLIQRVRAADECDFSEAHSAMIRDAYKKLANVLVLQESDTIVFLFRVGRSPAPSAYSARLPLESVTQFRV